MASNNETDNLPEVDFQNTQTYLQYEKKQSAKPSTSLIAGIAIFLLILFLFLYRPFKNKQSSTVVENPIPQSQTIQSNHLTLSKTQELMSQNQDQTTSKKLQSVEDQSEELPLKFNFPTEVDDEQKYKMLLGELKKLTSEDPQMSNIVKFLGEHHLNQLQQMKSFLPNKKGTNQFISNLNQKNNLIDNEEDSDEQKSEEGTIKELDESEQDENESGDEEKEEEDSEDEIEKMNEMESESNQQDDQDEQNIVHD